MSDITFSFSRTTSFNISCKAGLLATNSLNFCLSKKNFPLHFSRIISQGTEFWIGDFFCLFHQFKYFILFPSCLCGCWEAAEHNSHLYSSGVWYFFPLASFNIFSVYFITGTWANKPLGMCGEVGVGVGKCSIVLQLGLGLWVSLCPWLWMSPVPLSPPLPHLMWDRWLAGYLGAFLFTRGSLQRHWSWAFPFPPPQSTKLW